MVYVLSFDYPEGKCPDFIFEEHQNEVWGGRGMRKCGWGYPVPDDCAPPTEAYEVEFAPLSDVFPLPGTFAVSAKFKSIIEEFEPDVHQFFPVTLVRRQSGPKAPQSDVTYFVLNVCQRFDAMFTGPGKRRPIDRYHRGDEEGKPMIVIKGRHQTYSKQKIAGRHLWQGNIIGRGTNYISDALGTRLLEEDMKFMTISGPSEEIDAPWDPQENVGPVIEWLANTPNLKESIKKLHEEY